MTSAPKVSRSFNPRNRDLRRVTPFSTTVSALAFFETLPRNSPKYSAASSALITARLNIFLEGHLRVYTMTQLLSWGKA